MSVRPKKSLGQHFLVDENLLGVVGRLADLGPDDVVLEVGPGLGVLTRFLAARTRWVHAIELDRELEASLREALGGATNVRLTFGDALDLDLGSLVPPPVKLAANLPATQTTYHDATIGPGQVHVYQVKAVTAVGGGQNSNKVTITS